MAAAEGLNLERLRLADFNFTKCGRPVLPDGARYIDIPKVLNYNNVVPPSTTFPDERQGTHSDTVFFLRAISFAQSGSTGLLYVQFQWPNGIFLSNQPELINGAFQWGSYRRVLRAGPKNLGVQFAPGQQIRFSLQNKSGGLTAPVFIAFEGYLRYYLAPGTSPACCIEKL